MEIKEIKDITSEMYADWVMYTYSNTRAELAWLFEQLPRDDRESLAETILGDILDGLYTPPKKDEELWAWIFQISHTIVVVLVAEQLYTITMTALVSAEIAKNGQSPKKIMNGERIALSIKMKNKNYGSDKLYCSTTNKTTYEN